ncbi:MAG: PHP domain-containing protein, partial [Elusimicrobiota bacterium]
MNKITSKQEIDKGIPNGARFYKCALQLNPFEYLSRHKKTTEFSDEAAYNKAIIEACLANKIEVIAVTDHYRVQSSQNLMTAARAAGIQVIPGFEAV